VPDAADSPTDDAPGPTLVPVQPLIPDYEAAARRLFYDAVHAFMRAQDPVLDKLRTERVGHLPEASAGLDIAVGAHSGPIKVELRAFLSADATFTVDTDAWVAAAYETATSALDQLMPQFYAGLDRILERTGQVTSNRGEPFSWDGVIDGLEKMELNFDENGQPSGLTMVAGPEFVEEMQSTPMTPEQDRRWREVIERKREEFNARRRRRTLD
jgi:hypothetical protein